MDFPLTAIASIMHRVAGIALFMFIPFVLYFFKLSLESESSFDMAKVLISQFHIKIFLFLMYFVFLYHLFSGIKHMIMDIGYFETKDASRRFAIVSLFTTLFFYILSVLL